MILVVSGLTLSPVCLHSDADKQTDRVGHVGGGSFKPARSASRVSAGTVPVRGRRPGGSGQKREGPEPALLRAPEETLPHRTGFELTVVQVNVRLSPTPSPLVLMTPEACPRCSHRPRWFSAWDLFPRGTWALKSILWATAFWINCRCLNPRFERPEHAVRETYG